MARNMKARRGFTLVELLVVVLILAILMSLALPFYLQAVRNSERGTARTNMQTISTAEQAFRADDPQHRYLIIEKNADFAGLKDLAQGITGPGSRQYRVDWNDTGAPAAPANVQCANGELIPAGGIAIGTDDATDGCFIPGVSSN